MDGERTESFLPPSGESEQESVKEIPQGDQKTELTAEREFFGGESLEEWDQRERERREQEAQKQVSAQETAVRQNLAHLEKRASSQPALAKILEAYRPKFDALLARGVSAAKELQAALEEVIQHAREGLLGASEAVSKETIPETTAERLDARKEIAQAMEEVHAALEEIANGDESGLTGTWTRIQGGLVPKFFRSGTPKELHAALAEGQEHPRFLFSVISEQNFAIEKGLPTPNRLEVMSAMVPERLRGSYESLSEKEVPEPFVEEYQKMLRQVENRFFGRAADRAEALAAQMQTAADRGQGPFELPAMIRQFAAEARESEAQEAARYERAAEAQRKLYEAMKESAQGNPERLASIEARRATEEVFSKGEMDLSEGLKNTKGEPYDGQGPAIATFRHGAETRTGVVKFEFMDRQTRRGVTPGSGPLREVVGTIGYVGRGMDVPPVVARDLEGYGRVSVTEWVPGTIASRVPDWYLGKDGKTHPDVFRLAIADTVVGRLDGASRNILVKGDGSIVPIDFGSDISGDDRERFERSAPRYILDRVEESVPEELRTEFLAWTKSPERQIFTDALDALPEDQTGRKNRMNAAIDQITEAFVDPYDKKMPPYGYTRTADPVNFENSMGSAFLKQFMAYEQKLKGFESVSPAP